MSESPVETPAVTEVGQEPEAQDASKLPAWAREALTKANSEAAKYRTQVRDLEPKAKQFDVLEQASKSDVQRFQERLTATEQKAADAERRALVASVALEKGLPASLARRLQGETQADLEADADELLAQFPPADNGPRRPAPDASQGSSATGRSADQDAANWLQQLVRK